MSDFIWSLILGVLFVIPGLIFIRLGLAIWKKRKTELIISWHTDRVSDENKDAYCRLFGIGLSVIGVGFVISGVWMLFALTLYGFIPMAAGLAAGITLMILAVAKYNH